MKTYQVKSTKQNCQLSENNNPLGHISYPKWYSYQAVMETGEETLQIRPMGIWGNKILLEQSDTVVGESKINWNLSIAMTINKKEYLLKVKHLLNLEFVLLDAAREVVMSIDATMDWCNCRVDYEMNTGETFNAKEILFIVHNCNYMMAMNGTGMEAVGASA
ncbi:hypothetical protein [Chitinophaga nivalis]|uniref:Uncharacterized protein n=1 Tax=Chitinophaga nivalis TaxID=2991709 RepID=A0ABT3IH36_9BACT|nr:hypothetical protein [Chitinophaga nivalis]MCW3467053.1 hypothetical protein [Chitinophaga nivalis]MCW3483256.1 hypothetical protein [Chitinophaga nivalis]